MPSLRAILAAHRPLLILDAASRQINVGLMGADGLSGWEVSDEEAGIGVFRSLQALDISLETVGAFAFCEGPGSVLGIRTAAMAIRVWCVSRPRPVFGYFSLALVAETAGDPEVTAISDARRGHWHAYRKGGPLRRLPASELSGRLIMPEGFRHWAPTPAGVERAPYDLASRLELASDLDLFRPAEPPDAFLHEDPTYATWTPQVHRAP